jgi:hypothetical protein
MLRDRLPSYLLVTYLLLCGCATSKPDAPSTYESAVALQNQKSQYTHAWMAKADAAQTAFLLCVKSYAATHQQTTLTATELSGAAISACGQGLSEFRNDEQALYTLIDPDTASAYAQADRAVAQVTDGAKGVVLQMIAEQPPKTH